MEAFFLHLLHAALWVFFLIVLFAVIGVLATLRFIVNMIRGGERAIGSGIQSAESHLHRR